MTLVYIICEGRTEIRFVKNVLAPVLGSQELYLYPIRIGGRNRKGGNVTFDRLRINVRDQLNSNQASYCSTLFDFYGLPPNFPGKQGASSKSELSEKARTVQQELLAELGRSIDSELLLRFIPYVQMHEFEALLFSDPGSLAESVGRGDLSNDFIMIREEFATPEHIDDSPTSAPSKRILKLEPNYEKPLMGETAASAIGLAKIRQECPLFDAWLAKLENLQPLPA